MLVGLAAQNAATHGKCGATAVCATVVIAVAVCFLLILSSYVVVFSKRCVALARARFL